MNGNKEELMTINRFPNKKAICFAFGDNCICLGKIFKDGYGAILTFGVRKPIIWKVKTND
jgi:hypothetical protein